MSDLKQDSPTEQQDQPAWQRNSIRAGRFAGFVALHGFGGFAVAFTAYAVADMVPDGMWRAMAQVSLVVAAVGVLVTVAWIKTRGGGRRRNQSINSQAHNLSSRALNWRFRRG